MKPRPLITRAAATSGSRAVRREADGLDFDQKLRAANIGDGIDYGKLAEPFFADLAGLRVVFLTLDVDPGNRQVP